MNLKEKAVKLPLSPGVYMFIGQKGEILYIGRATSLKKRVLQYFRKDIDSRIAEMVSLAKSIRHKKTGPDGFYRHRTIRVGNIR